MSRKDVVILGSTGSIGTQALEIVRRHPRQFRVVGLTAGGGQRALFETQVAEFAPQVAGTGAEASLDAASMDVDVVLNAITGAAGLGPTIAALEAGNTLALANKESLIMGGEAVTSLAAPGQIVPVDSEHSAIAQCLPAGQPHQVKKLILTASGGPFRGFSRSQLAQVTLDQALAHPTWDMGPVVTINSATMVNKGLEVIEAHLLFGVDFDAIEVVVHPTSVVHSMVEFWDGSTILQASPPTMTIPIALGLAWPERIPDIAPAVDWAQAHRWEFTPVDDTVFPAVQLARAAGMRGRTAPAVYNAANEECVEAFRHGQLPFLGIVDTVAQVMEDHQEYTDGSLTVAEIIAADEWARHHTQQLLSRSYP